MWESDYKESWAPKNSCFWTVVLEKTLECPLDCKEIQPVHPKGDQSWIFLGRTGAEAETPILWLLMGKANWLRKTLMLGKIEGGGKGDNRGWDDWTASPTQWTWVWTNPGSWWSTGSLVCRSPWGHKELNITEFDWTTTATQRLSLWHQYPLCNPYWGLIPCLVGLNEAQVLDVSSQKNSVRDKVIGGK